MALSESDFTEPEGELRSDMFPGVDDLEAGGGYLETWLGEADSKVSASTQKMTSREKKTAKKAWVYARAYRQVWLRLTTNPREADLEEDGSLRYSDDQVAAFKARADSYEETYEDLAGEEPGPEPSTARSQTRSSTTRLF